MNIPEEAIQAALDAAFPGLPAGMTLEEAERRVRRAVEAAAPLIAAQVLRERDDRPSPRSYAAGGEAAAQIVEAKGHP